MKALKKIVSFGLIIVLVIGFYYYLSNIRAQSISSEDQVKASKVTEVLMRNLDTRYPPTPKEVVRFFAEITQIVYNENYSKQDFEGLAAQLYRLYDDELQENNIWDTYLGNFRFDIETDRSKNYVISSFVVSSATDVVYFSEDGFDYARLNCLFTVRQGVELYSSDHQFLLRKSDGRWKILGWQKVEL